MIVCALFMGGYHFILADQGPIIGPIVFFVKVVLLLCGMIWVRATLPRIRYDRLMAFGWKAMLPMALLAVGWSAFSLIIGDTFNSPALYFTISTIFFIVVAVAVLVALRPKPESQMRGDQVVLQPRGFNYTLLQVLGGLISIPFVLFGVTQKQLHNVQAALRSDTPPASRK